MSVVIILLLVLFFVGIKRRKNGDYLSRDVTLSVTGLFALIIFCSHFFDYIDKNSISLIDTPLLYFITILGQLMVSPFLFFSGYGVFESFKKKGQSYVDSMPKHRIVKLFLSFLLAWIVFASISLFFKSNYSLSDYLLSIFGIKTIGNSSWYVVVIIILYFISYLSFSFNHKNLLFSHFLLVVPFYIILTKIAPGEYWYNTLLCYFFGACYSNYRPKIDEFLNKKKHHGLLLLLICIFSFCLSYYLYIKNTSLFLHHFLYCLSNLFFCLTIVLFLYHFRIKNRILLFLGANCFWIYILQRVPMIVFSHSNLLSNNRYIYFCLCLFSTILMAFLFGKFFSYAWNIIFLRKGEVGEVTNYKVGIVISYITLALSILGAFVVTPLLLQMLGDVQYGLRSFATSIATWLTVVSSALSASYLRFINLGNRSDGIGEGKTNSLYLKVFLTLSIAVLLITAVGVSICFGFNVSFGNYSEPENKLIIILLLISGINLAIQIAFASFTHYLTYKKEFIFIRGLALVTTFLTFALELIFVFLTKSVIAVSLATLFLTIVSAILTAFFAIKTKKMRFEKESILEDRGILKAIIVFSSFVLLNAVVDQMNKQVDITILGFMTNAENVTSYTLAHYFSAYLVSLSLAVSSIYSPKVHEFAKDGSKKELNLLFQKVSKMQMIIILFAVGGFAACGHSFIKIWLGDSKEYIFYYSLVLLSINIIPLSCTVSIEIQRALNKHKFRAILYIIIAILNVTISATLIATLPSSMSVWGAIIGTVFSIIVGNSIILNIYNHVVIKINMKSYFLNVIKYLCVTAIAIAPTLLISLNYGSHFSNIVLFLINGSLFSLIYLLELFIIDHKIVIPLAKKVIKRIIG